MISKKLIHQQLKNIDFSPHGWNKSEVAELHQIILPDEKIFECVNGLYEGGFALLVATDVRVLLIDKKPLNFLKVEDLRFDMINEIDYNHRLMGANISIATGSKSLNFRSYNKERLRKLIGHVQHCMAENKREQSSHAVDQKQHLEQINQQLQAYLLAQYKQQQKLQEHLTTQPKVAQDNGIPEPVKPSNELADYLYAHGLLEKYREETGKDPTTGQALVEPAVEPKSIVQSVGTNSQLDEIYADGIQEVFGKQGNNLAHDSEQATNQPEPSPKSLEVNPIRIAYSKLPMVLRSRKFGLDLPTLPFPLPKTTPKVP